MKMFGTLLLALCLFTTGAMAETDVRQGDNETLFYVGEDKMWRVYGATTTHDNVYECSARTLVEGAEKGTFLHVNWVQNIGNDHETYIRIQGNNVMNNAYSRAAEVSGVLVFDHGNRIPVKTIVYKPTFVVVANLPTVQFLNNIQRYNLMEIGFPQSSFSLNVSEMGAVIEDMTECMRTGLGILVSSKK